MPFRTTATATALARGLEELAEVIHAPLPSVVARLQLRDGNRPLLWIDSDSPPEDQWWAMIDALRILGGGQEAAESARRVRRLHSVS